MTVAFGDHQVTNWASEIEARTIGARLREPVLDPGRYPGPEPYWGIPRIRSFPFTGRAAMVVGDLGPLRPCPNDGVTACEGSLAGTPPPPLDNNPNTEGVDPHGPDWAQVARGRGRDRPVAATGRVPARRLRRASVLHGGVERTLSGRRTVANEPRLNPV